MLNTPNQKRMTRRLVKLFTGERKFPYWEHQREHVEADLLRLLGSSVFRRFENHALVPGLHGGPVFCYMKEAPRCLRATANYWKIISSRIKSRHTRRNGGPAGHNFP